MATYIALLHKDADSDFGVTFLDFPGCVSAANDLDGLRRGAAEALALHIEGMAEEGDEIPQPTSLNDYTRHPEADPTLPIMLIEWPIALPRAIRISVTLPEDVLQAIDGVSSNSQEQTACRSLKPVTGIRCRHSAGRSFYRRASRARSLSRSGSTRTATTD